MPRPVVGDSPIRTISLLEDERTVVGLITDLFHVHPALIKMICHLAGVDRINLISDAIAALGLPPCTCLLGEQEVTCDDKTARLADGTLAGCILPLNLALRNFIRATQCDFFNAVKTITNTPAKLLGLSQKGQIKPGKDAVFVLMWEDFPIIATEIAGEIGFLKETTRIQS